MLPTPRRTFLAGLAGAAALLSTGRIASAGEPCDGNIVDALASSPYFTTLVTAVQAAGLTGALQGDGPLTVFAPTDRAFAKLPPDVLDLLLNDPNALANVLTYHVVPEQLLAADVLSQAGSDTLLGEDLTFTVAGANVFVDQAKVVFTDYMACNGVVHVIDEVLLPSVEGAGGTTFDIVGNLLYANAKTGDFSTLLAAVETAGLTSALQGAGPLTLFAPTDRAFGKLPPGTLQSLLADPPALADILLYHVVPQELFAADVVALPSATTLQGADVVFSASSTGVFVNMTSQVVFTDVDTSNGVVHVINEVLLPPSP